MVQDIMKARTTSQIEAVIKDTAPDDQHAIPQLVQSLVPCMPLLILLIGGSG